MRRVVRYLLLALSLSALAPTTALAEWRRAQSEHFVVYSDGPERSLRDYTAKLERFDALLTARFGVGRATEARRLPVYLVGDGRDLRVAIPGLPPGIAGYYSASDIDIFAVLVRGESDDILLHEYSHHVMARAGDVRYPGWFREGFAEFFATATVTEGGEASFGLPDRGRLYALQQNRWLPMDVVLRADGSLAIDGQTGMNMYYAQSWALTHWLLADTGRIRNLSAYVTAVNGGRDPVEAWQAIYSMTPDQLTAQLRAHVRGRLSYTKLDMPPISPVITVTTLSPAADAVLLPAINTRFWNPEQIDGPALLETLRTAAARFPDDPLALVAVARAEKRWGDAAAAEAALTRALDRQGDNVEGLVLMADLATERGADAEGEAERTEQWDRAREFLRRALEADPADYQVHAARARFRRYARD
ncbi:MAG: tetratricopeptide repeat protein [Brevundimonas sp.]